MAVVWHDQLRGTTWTMLLPLSLAWLVTLSVHAAEAPSSHESLTKLLQSQAHAQSAERSQPGAPASRPGAARLARTHVPTSQQSAAHPAQTRSPASQTGAAYPAQTQQLSVAGTPGPAATASTNSIARQVGVTASTNNSITGAGRASATTVRPALLPTTQNVRVSHPASAALGGAPSPTITSRSAAINGTNIHARRPF